MTVVIPRHIDELELRGGDPALDFANTLEGVRGAPPGTEHLGDYRDLLAWAVRARLLTEPDGETLGTVAAARPDDAAAALRTARSLRAAVHEVFDALAAGRPAPPGALTRLRDAHAAAIARARLEPGDDGRHGWTWIAGGDDLERPLHPVAVAAVDLLRSPDLARLGACGQCRWLFLDRSRNRSRRWCSMRDCGAQAKMRRYRAAHRD